MLKDFISRIGQRGLARSNRYLVRFANFPGSNLTSDSSNLIELFCETTQLPGISYGTAPSRTFGEERQFPYERIFENITMVFYVDSDMKIKTMFDNWFYAIANPVTRTFNYYNDYTTNVTISLVSLESKGSVDTGSGNSIPIDEIPYEITLHEIYPKTMSSINLEAGAKDIMRLPVTFQYKWWEPTNLVIDQTGVDLGFKNGLEFNSSTKADSAF